MKTASHFRLRTVPALGLTVMALVAAAPCAQAAATGFLYVLRDAVPNVIYGFAVNEDTGALTALAGFPVQYNRNGVSGSGCDRLALDRKNARLFVANGISITVNAFSIDQATGALTPAAFGAIFPPATTATFSLAVHPSGSPLLIVDNQSKVWSYRITPATATLVAGSPFTTGTAVPFSSVFSKNGSFFYTGGASGGDFAGFSVDPASGVLTALAGSPFNSGTIKPLSYATDADGRLFMANSLAGNARVFTTAAGIPSAATGNPFASGLSEALQGVLHPGGFYMVADRTAGKVGVYKIAGSGSATTLAAVAGSPFASGGANTQVLALNRDGKYLFAANSGSFNLTTFTVNASTGALTAPVTQPANTLGSSPNTLTGIAYMPPAADLTVSMTGTPQTVAAGSGPGNLVYTVSVKNNGPADATGLAATDTLTLPAGVTVVSANSSAGAFNSATGVWTIGNLAVQATATLTLTLTVGASTEVGANVIANSAAVTSVNENLTNLTDDAAAQSTSVTFTIVSGPSATPATAGVNQSVAFGIVPGGSGLAIAWDFGDGSPAASGANVTHAYAAAGNYAASVTVSGFGGAPLTGTVQVAVNAPVVGGGSDSDGDGFSDDAETLAGTDPNSAASTPTGQPATPGALTRLTLTKASIKLNFIKSASDSISFSGTLAIPADFDPETRKVGIDVGGVGANLALNAKGAANVDNNALKISIKFTKGKVEQQTAKYSVSLKKGGFAAALADEKLTGEADAKGEPRTVVFTVVFNNKVLQISQLLSYTARKGKTGSAKEAILPGATRAR